jgi:4-hydroxy-3-methylbut-2-enyl diphosphate reductase
VILPAFGATIQEMQLLDSKGVQVVDTTCPWVSKVWNAVDNHRKLGQTSIIHGKWAHEETVATASFCDDYIIVKDMKEAEYVANYIVNGGDKVEFMEKFKNAVSKGFDPDVHLVKVGLANQTTMYKRETKAIGRLLEVTMLKKFGPENLAVHYAEFDTICDATQVCIYVCKYGYICVCICIFICVSIYTFRHEYYIRILYVYNSSEL